MVYGGTIRAGSCEGLPQLDVVSAFQAYGKYLQDGKTPEAEIERQRTIRHAVPGCGACGGVSNTSCVLFHLLIRRSKMYTANTMSSAIEALGMSLPGSSSFPAESAEKQEECKSIGGYMRNLLSENILPKQIMTRSAFENAMVCGLLDHPQFRSDCCVFRS
jgi:dihydroxy-acid dehydratase